MLRLAKYVKPYSLLILLTVFLLFVQANADLALPDYLSRIINNGIQQGGVENAVPLALRQSTMERLLLFLDAADRSLVLRSYTLVDQSSPDYEGYLAEYPVLAGEPVYVRNEIDRTEIDILNPVMGQALVVVSGIEQMVSDPERAAAMAESLGFDLAMLPPGMDIYAALSGLPQAQRAQVSAAIQERFDALGESMVEQMAIGAVKSEYEALGMDTGALQSGYIRNTGIQMLLISLLGGTCTVAVGYLAAKTAAGSARDIRRAVFRKVESFSSTEFDKFSTASLITRSTNDVTQVQMVIFMLLRMVFYAPLIGIGAVLRAIDKSASMWWIIGVAVLALLSLILVVFSITLPKFKIMQSLVDRINLISREHLTGMMVIRAFNKQEFETERFDRANRDLTNTSLFVARVMVTMMPVMLLLMNGLSVLIIWTGAHEVAEANMQVGDMMAFLQYAMQIVFSFLMLSMMFIFLPRASVSGSRIADVLETEPAITDAHEPESFREPFTGGIEFRNVSFRYPGALDDVLHDITFTAQAGQTTAFIGSTGSGKSTIVNLIPRFYDVTTGAIYIDGMDIRQVRQIDLRDKIGYIPQRGTLFSGTIQSNLRYADENASDDALREAVRIAQASEFIDSNPQGFEAEIAQGGSNVSGGQNQRLSIARALVKKPPILIFDDSFSALDFKTESALRRALKENNSSSTKLIVTQRVSTIMNADQIVVLDEGQIVGKGKHAELMESCQEYREIAQSQLSSEELA